jgi:hypothetical protein
MSLKRLNIGASIALSIGAFLMAAHPRLTAWTQTANSNLIAEQRAATCALMVQPVRLGQRPSPPMNPGQYACHWDGTTGQVLNTGTIGHIKNGQPESITAILKERGYRNETN